MCKVSEAGRNNVPCLWAPGRYEERSGRGVCRGQILLVAPQCPTSTVIWRQCPMRSHLEFQVGGWLLVNYWNSLLFEHLRHVEHWEFYSNKTHVPCHQEAYGFLFSNKSYTYTWFKEITSIVRFSYVNGRQSTTVFPHFHFPRGTCFQLF